MRRCILVLVLALLLVVTGLAPVAALGRAADTRPAGGKVVLDPLPKEAEVGRKVTMTGKAPAGRTVLIERRDEGRWRAVTGTRARANGTFSERVSITKAGRLAYRASVVGGATSAPRALVVFRWLWVTEQPVYAEGRLIWDHTTTTPGKPLPHSVEGHSGTASVVVKVGRCDRAEAFATFPVYDTELFEGDEFQELILSPIRNGELLEESQQSIGTDNAGSPPKKLATGLLNVDYLVFFAGYEDADGNDDIPAVMGSPRVHCAAESLPEIDFDEVPF